MEWFSENWLWVIVFILFVAIHIFGHGHGMHDGHTQGKPMDEDVPHKSKHGHH